MRQGRVKISGLMVTDALGFPPDWRFEDIKFDAFKGNFEAVISGSDFPDDSDGIKDCALIVHKEKIRFEVKER